MEKNQLIKLDGVIYRVLAVEGEGVLLIDCLKKAMPKWYGVDEVSGHEVCSEEELGGRNREGDGKGRRFKAKAKVCGT